MSEISKQALAVENSTNFPNNNTGYITPSLLRSFNTDMIDSLVDEITYQADSASWNQQITALETFTSSQQPAFSSLNAFTASQLTINSGVNSFTQSANSSLTQINAQTASFQTWTGSINQIQSNGTTLGTSTRFNLVGPGTFFSASLVQNVGGPIATLTFTSDNGKVNTSSFNDYTASAQAELDALSSSVAHAGYATTGSNTFTGQQTINSTLQLSDGTSTPAQIYANALTNGNVAVSTNLQLAGTLTASLQEGYLLVGNGSGITSLLSTGSFVTEDETGSLARLGANQIFTGNNTFTGNTVVSQSAAFGTASFYGPMVISKGIAGNVQLTGSLNVAGGGNIVMNNNGDIFLGGDPYSVYNGIGLTQANGDYAIVGYGTNSSVFNFGVVDSSGFTYSTELLATATPSKITFQDFSFGDYSYQTWLTLAANNGSNPSPIFNRGIVSSGSFVASGSVTITGSVYQNVNAVTISSSTASIDLSKANYFTLTLAGTTNINVINPRPGVTATLVITTDTAASASFSSNVKQPSGSFYAASPSGNVDIISFTAVNSNTVYAFPAQTFV